ncbi:iron complex transport system ATP-binding protein [Streptococcus gallinaceus]|uniref:Iron complex transport system ATP-binding protein n=1 Tax=Streptococcus gallinaceus TaxID=165758 RepID=A0ABV2JQZ2_9STRE
MIKVEQVSKTYGQAPVLQVDDLQVFPKRFTAFIGPNGAGKSTLLSLMSRLMKKEEGCLYIKGQEIDSWGFREFAQELAILKQQIHCQSKLTVEELVSFGRFPYSQGRLKEEDFEKIQAAIAHMGLDEFRDRYVDQLSGGQLQRVFIAMVLAQDTDIILLDEPLNNLDMKQGILMMRTLRDLVDKMGKTVVVVIHDINVASQFVDHMVAFKDGQVFCQGSPSHVMKKEVLEEIYDINLELAIINGRSICLYQ